MNLLAAVLPVINTPPVQTKEDGAGIWLAVIVVGLIVALVAILYFMNDSLKRTRVRFEGTEDARAVRQTPYEKARARAEARERASGR